MRVGDDCNDQFRRERTGPPTVSRLLTQLIARHNEARNRPGANEQPETTMTGTRRSLLVDGRPPSMVGGNPAPRCSAPPATLNHKTFCKSQAGRCVRVDGRATGGLLPRASLRHQKS